MADNEMNLLMVHADDHAPVMEEVPDKAIVVGEADAAMPEHLWDEGGDPNDLYAQRWGVIAPEGARGDRLLQIIKPLIDHRQSQQEGEPVKIYRVPDKMSQSEAAVWKKTVFRNQSDLDIDIPRYQLILGDLHEVPLALQQIQGSDGFVGRLAFDRDEDYAAYVDKVLRWEGAPTTSTEGRAIFHTVHDGTAATRIGYKSLITPGMAVVQARMDRGQFNADQIVETGDKVIPDPQELLNAAVTDRPGFLFSLSHGEGPPRSGWRNDELQRSGQGAMSFGREGKIRGEDLRDATFMPGGVWFMLACFGAGSPDASAYHHWLSDLRKVGQFGNPDAVLAGIPKDRPFIAQIPKNVLASANGPLAFFGHIDLAWTYSFQELDQGATNRPAKFMGILRSALKRDRIGIGFRELYRFFDQANTELTAIADEQRAGRISESDALVARSSHLWMLRQDLSTYILLGDPAARLPLADRRAAPRPQPTTSASTFGFASTAAPKASPAVELPIDIDELEEAIGKVMVGDDSLKTIAKEYGLDRSELRRLADAYREAGRGALGVKD